MANIITIDYLYRDNGEITDLLFYIASSNVGFDWSSEKSRITIYWEPFQEEEVRKILELVSKRFKEPTISIKNEKTYEYSEEETNIEVVETENFSEEVLEEKIEVDSEESKTCEEKEAVITLLDKPSTEDSKEEVYEEVSVEEIPIQETCSTEEEASVKEIEVIAEEEKIEEPVAIKEEISKEEFMVELKDLFNANKYSFKDPETDAFDICKNLEIKNETLKYALVLTNATLTKETLISRLAKKFHKNNTALAGVALRGNFKKMMDKYPEILLKYPQITVFDFLNCFRKENKQI